MRIVVQRNEDIADGIIVRLDESICQGMRNEIMHMHILMGCCSDETQSSQVGRGLIDILCHNTAFMFVPYL